MKENIVPNVVDRKGLSLLKLKNGSLAVIKAMVFKHQDLSLFLLVYL
jgi:hypothetical protein